MTSMWKMLALSAILAVGGTGCIIVGGNTCGFSGDPCCSTGTQCNAGLTCNASNICVSNTTQCGGITQACCTTGTACTPRTGAVCDSNNRCNLSPYVGCDASSASTNASCSAGTSQTGNIIATTCRRAQIAIGGTVPNQGFCSAACNASGASECPAVGNATTDCYLLQAGQPGVCAVACPNGATDCGINTQCVQTTNALGTQIRICIQNP